MHKNVEILIGRLATDPTLLEHFAKNPLAVLREQGLELNAIELDALAATSPKAFSALTAALDARICKASIAIENRSNRGITTTESQKDSK